MHFHCVVFGLLLYEHALLKLQLSVERQFFNPPGCQRVAMQEHEISTRPISESFSRLGAVGFPDTATAFPDTATAFPLFTTLALGLL